VKKNVVAWDCQCKSQPNSNFSQVKLTRDRARFVQIGIRLTLFLLSFNLTIFKNMPEKEHFGIYKKSKLFPKDQLQMEHYKLLMVPEN
jgi:hypothetical protein